ncbi:hypothetical protein TBLA_0C00260 [Henningerozyma blattae CBS 6284]|uniref:Enoyl reductase (ER) domain-containing protein n=1 Tax=Henningerozyma blattae (strain ATCC 34711 / CBS 6284 / DSM 70876 / NBRC 10599 / NRRL Y-10934 / UCD 77-7) TaxID=1071380 RepID=I2H0E1_HENB6|nr:hypothetical protein TBLA_0C00260 [Tetrapisispora blattae CBS 6284]CCH59843.1 hypothetical protein TBLA_0C00260 [Tetrapisispora blattae CBS 6284]
MIVDAKQWVIKNEPTPGKPFNFDFKDKSSTFELITKKIDTDKLKEDEILVKTLLLSNDPAQKMWIASVDKNYAKGTSKGDQIPSRGIAKVIFSKNANYQINDIVSANVNWTNYNVISDFQFATKLNILPNTELFWYLSVFGGTSLTAYFIFYRYAELKEVEADYEKTYLISGAAGAVGSVCIQLALNVFKAKKVIAIAGGKEKVAFVESFGDRVIGVDYKDANYKEHLFKAAGGENTVDIFIDNIGSDTLEYGTTLLKPHGYLIVCGAISAYNDHSKFVYKSYASILTKRLTIKGLLLMDNRDQFPKAIEKLSLLIEENKLSVDKSATIVDALGDKFEDIPLIWNGLFNGINKGKLITKINDE